MSYTWKFAVVATTAAVVLAGCGGSGGGSTGAQGAIDVDALSECPALGGDIDKASSFTWMYSTDMTSFDPDKITAAYSVMYLYPIYDSLVHIDESGVAQPMLAESWEVLDGGNALQMTLIDGWTYHDGTPFDAQSVVANIERHKRPGFNENTLAFVTGVSAVDDRTVRFDTDGGALALVNVLSGPAGMMMSPAVMDDPSQAVRPTGGSGAFRLGEYVSGDRIVYKAVENYYAADDLNVSEFVIRVSGNDNARLNAVTTGDADATFLRASMFEAAQQAGLTMCVGQGINPYQIVLNTKRSEFGDPKVREALNYAVDRDAAASPTSGLCEVQAQHFPSWYWAASPDVDASYYSYDPDKARSLLAEAGLPNGFSFEMAVQNTSDLYMQFAQILQANFADVGVQMTITPLDSQTRNERFSVGKDLDAMLYPAREAADPSEIVSSYYTPGGFENPGGWGTDKLTALEVSARNGTTQEARAEAYREFFNAAMEEVPPTVTLCTPQTVYATNGRVEGLEIYADGSRQFRAVGVRPGN